MALAIAILILLAGYQGLTRLWQVNEVSGTILFDGKPLAGATVRIKTTGYVTTSDQNGRFILIGFPSEFRVPVTAWLEGYYIGGYTASPWNKQITITLQPHLTSDNPDYQWISPKVEGRSALESTYIRSGLAVAAKLSFNRVFMPLAAKLTLGCADCHGSAINDQWASSAHAQGTANIRFMNMYNGTNVAGQSSPPTRYGVNPDYGSFPLRPNTKSPYYGPGFKLDFPDQAGNCADCHAPTAALANPGGTDINTVKGIDAQGITCDYCHKMAGVKLDPATQQPAANMPGVLSTVLRRPASEPQVFFGPYDDVDVGPDTFSPVQTQSQVCAPCHNASFWGTPIYQSYAEWLASPYPSEGKSCQSCHMKPDGRADNFAPGRGGLTRDVQTVFTHNFPGAADTDLLQHTARLEVTARQSAGRVLVDVQVTNENGGHDIPTDQPMRNIILVVQATDSSGRELTLSSGPVVPDWGGMGSASSDYAGRPGRGYAKVLEELWTEVSPSASYWQKTAILSDTRISARETDFSHYEFASPATGPANVAVKLIFRRAFKYLEQQKGWNDADIIMNQAQVTILK